MTNDKCQITNKRSAKTLRLLCCFSQLQRVNHVSFTYQSRINHVCNSTILTICTIFMSQKRTI